MLLRCINRIGVVSAVLAALCILTPVVVIAQAVEPGPIQTPSSDLTQMSLEDLMSVQVTSVSKKAEKLFDSSAAAYVISSEDIRRSGATSIPEALRMAPGLWVARIDSSKWIVSSRGFGERFSNKLLVLIDGRSVYTPLFSGVWWDSQDIPMEDIERIEVIRGPGATMWGANAVNGVINIITKSSKDTAVAALTTLSGTSDLRSLNDVHYGGQAGSDTYYRVYARRADRANYPEWNTPNTGEGWHQDRIGFAAEKYLPKGGQLSLQANTYNGGGDQMQWSGAGFWTPAEFDFTESGTNILAKWSQSKSALSGTDLQFYYDRTKRYDLQDREVRDTYDLEFQRRFATGSSHKII